MSERNIVFANIASNPTPNSWAQAYNAGRLFAVLSLKKDLKDDNEEEKEEESLNAIGKKVLNTLEQEFFTLEEKDLRSIKNAIEVTIQKIPDELEKSFIICAIVSNIVYIFGLGEGRVNIKRGDQFGTLLKKEETGELKAVSGNVKDNDLIILQTKQFANLINLSSLSEALNHQTPSEISEILAPKIHGTEEGGAAAVIFEYKDGKGLFDEEKTESIVSEDKENEEPKVFDEEEKEEKMEEERAAAPMFSGLAGKIRMPKIRNIPHSKKLFLTIAVVILAVFAISLFLANKKQQDAKTQAVFNQYFPQAQKKYNEGEGLVGLNQNLARESFQTAKDLLNQAKDKLPKDSGQEKQVLDLLTKTDKVLAENSGVTNSSAKQVGNDASNLLAFEQNHTGSYFIVADKNIYYVDDKGINLSDGKTNKTIIKNGSTWKEPGGLGFYFGNIYLLDKKDGILKFTSTSGEYGKSTYFSDTAPDLSKTSGIAIDGSVWILSSNGSIEKFTKGKSDNLKLSGLDMAFKNPTRIWTSLDSSKVYVLDNGNSRIVVLGKDGGYKEQYQASIIKDAKDFDVQETAKKVFVLSGGKIYEIDLK